MSRTFCGISPDVLVAPLHSLDAQGALEVEGLQFISPEEALRDPAYQRPDVYLGQKGLSWLYRIAPTSDADIAWDDEEAERLRARLEGR